jgi:adenylate cyclase
VGYDRLLRDIFAVQDEIVRRIVATLNLQLNLEQQGVAIPRSTENLEAYDDLLQGVEYLFNLTKNGNVKARAMFEKAIELDPKYAMAYAYLGQNYYLDWGLSFSPDPNRLQQALQMERKAVALDDSLSVPHSVLADIYMQEGQNDEAATEAERGIALDTNSALAYSNMAEVLNHLAKPAEALIAVDRAMRLDPRNPDYLYEQGRAYNWLGRWQEAIPALKG